MFPLSADADRLLLLETLTVGCTAEVTHDHQPLPGRWPG